MIIFEFHFSINHCNCHDTSMRRSVEWELSIAKNDTIFQLNMAKNIAQDFGKTNILLNSFVTFFIAV